MPSQLLLDLSAKPGRVSVHFCEQEEIASIHSALLAENIFLSEIDGTSIHTLEEMFKAFAVALNMPKGWYGDEEYAPNANAFLEYLDDVHEWVPAKGHVVVVRGAEQFWGKSARLGGMLVEWWQFATGSRGCKVHLVFVW